MSAFFFYGTLCYPPLLAAILGREVVTEVAVLPGHSVFWARGQAFPLIISGGAGAVGLLAENLSDNDLARLDFYEGGFTYVAREALVSVGERKVAACVYFPEPGQWQPDAPWSLEEWVRRWGPTAVATAGDFMRYFGRKGPAELRRRYSLMLMRGGARVRAETRLPAGQLRRPAAPGDVVNHSVDQPYANYFSVEEYQLSFRRFDGSMSEVLNRAVFISGDAAVVLPYDPRRDRVLVIEQFRMGPHARGDGQPWLIEAVAGRIDGGETPEEAARREAREEAGVVLHDLLPAASYYPSPAAKGEYLYTFVGLADLPDTAAGLGGLVSEAEDIRAHVIPFATLMELVESGEADNAPLILLAMWLDRRRAELRAAVAATDASGA